MADGSAAVATGIVLIARRFAPLFCLFVWASVAWAQSFAQTNQQALEAFNAGDLETALNLTRSVTDAGAAAARGQPDAYLLALNNLTLLRSLQDAPGDEVSQLAERALRFADDTAQISTPTGLSALVNAGRANADQGERERSREIRARLLREGRGSQWHGAAISAAVDLAFANGDVTVLPLLIEEMIGVTGGYQAQTTITALAEAQNDREAQGDIDGVSALIDARILLASQIIPDQVDQYAHALLWRKFYMNYEAANYARAAEGLRAWAETGTLSEEEQAFLETQAEAGLTLSQGEAFGADRGAALGFAELTLAYAQAAYRAGDYRIGLALRERAFAHGAIGNFERAAIDLQDALLFLTTDPIGQGHVHLVLEDLATNAWQRGALEQADQLFVQARAAYETVVTAGESPLGPFDLSISALNRARLAAERGAFATARTWLTEAETHFETHMQSGEAKQNSRWHIVHLAQANALIAAGADTAEAGVAAALDVVDVANRYYPPNHPDRANALANAADQLLVYGDRAAAVPLLTEALEVARVALPPNAPFRADIHLKLALEALSTNDMSTALAQLKAAATIHQAPENRRSLASGTQSFELLSWALLNKAGGTRDDVDAALAALQWTHTSRSASAYAMMAARLVAEDPAVATLIKQRQDVLAALDDNQSTLTRAFARGEDTAGGLARRARLQRALKDADAALAEADLALTGQAPIDPLALADIQARLAENEVLITFLLPGLKTDLVPGVGASSNIALAIRRDDYKIAVIPEDSRGALNHKISAFRCLMAISDPGCSAQTTAALRGAMTLDAPDSSAPGVDWSVAHTLYLDLFSGVAPMLQRGDHLVLVPPSDLLRLPFQALLTDAPDKADPVPDQWLIRAHPVSVLPSIAAFETLKAPDNGEANAPRFLGIGDPVIGNAPDMACDQMALASLRSAPAWPQNLYAAPQADGVRLADVAQLRAMTRLPDATCELEAIATAFGTGQSALRTRGAASETEIKQMNADGTLADFSLLVFATHGVVAGETSAVAPGLVLTPPTRASEEDDGLLTAAEVATLSLAARLVILSACNTAAGADAQQEGLSGLASGFFHAGAQSVLVTHWAVFSDASAEVSARVSKTLAQDPAKPIARNLQQVILGILDDPSGAPRTKHPSYWAPFTLVGL